MRSIAISLIAKGKDIADVKELEQDLKQTINLMQFY